MSSPIKSFKITDFKNIASINVNLKDINILIGSNNSGKTSILQAIHMMTSLMQSIDMVDGFPRRISGSTTSTISPNQILYTPFFNIDYFAKDGKLTQARGFTLEIEFSDGEKLSISVKKGKNKNLVVTYDNLAKAKLLADLNRPFSIFVPGLAGITKFETLLSLGVIRRALARGDANIIFRNVLYKLKDSPRWSDFQDALKLIFPDHQIEFKFDEAIDENFDTFVKVSTNKIPIDAMGTGFLQISQILSYSFLFHPHILLLDEPDSHIHPNNQRKLIKVLESLGIQTIIATHSRHIIDATKSSSNFWVKTGGISKFDSNLEILLDIGAIDQAEGLLINNEVKNIILTEDEDTGFIDKLMESHIPKEKYSLWSYKGSTKIGTAVAVAKVIHSITPNINIIVHRDRDCLSESYFHKQRAELSNNNVSLFVTKNADIEAYFTDQHYLQSINPEKSNEVAQAIQNINANLQKYSKIYLEKLQDARDIEHKAGLSTSSKEDLTIMAQNPPSPQDINGKQLLRDIRTEFQKLAKANLKSDLKSDLLKDGHLSTLLKE